MKTKCSCVPILASSLECLLNVSWWPKCRSKTNQLGLTPYFIIILNLFNFSYLYTLSLVLSTWHQFVHLSCNWKVVERLQ